MFRINFKLCAFICATLLTTTTLLLPTTAALTQADDQQQQQQQADYDDRKPWPTYSFQNMPKTRFTCSDKILGGYYADPETQCQMFHVCVKLPGVGIRDYRFLCPNGTLFDQDTQICANWNDVYCDQTGQYFGSNGLAGDNNDLYRSGFDNNNNNKRADEDEDTFHLQRAESGDVRRSKERNEQKTRPAHRFEATTRNHYNTQVPSKKPIVSFYTPTTTTTTTSTTERYNDDSKQDFDDIFKGSHSSHFFANRNGGREDDFTDNHPKTSAATSSKSNDFTDFNKKSNNEKSRVPQNRGSSRSTTSTTTTTTTTTSAPITKYSKKITLHASYNTDFLDYAQFYKSTTQSTTASSSTANTPTARPAYSNASRFGFSFSDYNTQDKIQPTTYNPNNSNYRYKSTTASTTLPPKHEPVKNANNLQDYGKQTISGNSRKAQKQKLAPQESNFVNHNEFVEYPKVKQAQPQPFQASPNKAQNISKSSEPQYFRVRGPVQTVRLGSAEPAPFSAPATQPKTRVHAIDNGRTRGSNNGNGNANGNGNGNGGGVAISSQRAITNRGSITYKATTQRNSFSENYYTATTNNVVPGNNKKYAAGPKDSITPTTFKPTTYKKAYDQSFYQTSRPSVNKPQKPYSFTKISSSTTEAPKTDSPYNVPYTNADEDDGQYHPELYEQDFPRNRIKHLRARTTTSTTTSTTVAPSSFGGTRQAHNHNYQHAAQSHLKTQQQTSYQKEKEQAYSGHDSSDDEDELFNTAQSLNFGAASINKLRADIYKAEKTSQQYNSQYSPNAPSPSPSSVFVSSPKTVAPTTSTTSNYNAYAGFYTGSSTAYTTGKPFSSTTFLTTPTPTTTTTSTTSTTTTRRPTTSSSTTTTTTIASAKLLHYDENGKSLKSGKSNKKDTKTKSKRPPHADEDSSYDYAYYDTDTLVRDYPE